MYIKAMACNWGRFDPKSALNESTSDSSTSYILCVKFSSTRSSHFCFGKSRDWHRAGQHTGVKSLCFTRHANWGNDGFFSSLRGDGARMLFV